MANKRYSKQQPIKELDWNKLNSQIQRNSEKRKAENAAKESQWAKARQAREAEKQTESYKRQQAANERHKKNIQLEVRQGTDKFNAAAMTKAKGREASVKAREKRESRRIPSLEKDVVKRHTPIGSNHNYSNFGYAYKTKELTDEGKIQKWLDPNYKMSDREKLEANDLIKAEQKRRTAEIRKGNQDLMIPGTEEYNRNQTYNNLEAKVKNAGTRGFLLPFLKATNALVKGTEKLTGTENSQAAKALNKQLDTAFTQDELSAGQNPIRHGVGNFAGMGAMYSATNPAFDAAAEGLGLTGTAGKVIANQVGQNLQDIALDTLPEYQRLKDKGLSDSEIRKEIGKNIAFNVAGNAAMQGLSDFVIPKLGKRLGILQDTAKTTDIPKVEEPTVKEIEKAVQKQTDEAKKVLKEAEPIEEWTRNQLKAEQTIPKVEEVTEAPKPVESPAKSVSYKTAKNALNKDDYTITTIHTKKGNERFVVHDADGNPVFPNKTFKTKDDAIKAYNEKVASAGDSAPKTPNAPNMKISDAYENTLKNSGIMTDDEIARRTVPENFSFESHSEVETMAEGARMRDTEGEDFVPNRLEKEGFTAADVDGMMQAWRDKVAEARAADEAGENSDALWEEANTIFRKIQQESSRGGAALQAMAKWSRNTPEGMLSDAENIVNKRIKVEGAKDGTSKQVKDAINKRMDKAAVEKQKPILTQAAEAYRSFADRITQSADASEYEGSVNNIRRLNDAINKFEKALDDGNIGRIQETYTALKRRAASMSKKGLSVDVDNKDVEDAIKNLVKHSRVGGFEFSADFQKTFINEASRIQDLDPNSREFKEAYARLGRMVNDEIRRNTSAPKLLGQRITAYLMNNMLGNFRTLITRNAGGNLGLALTEQFAERPLAAGIDRLVAKKTGIRTQAGLSKAALKDYITGFAKGISEEVQDVKSGLHTSRSGEVDLKDAIARNSDVFKTDSKNILLKGLSGLARFKNSAVAHGLSVGDRPFYEAIYKQTLGDMNRMKEEGLLGDAIQNLTDAEYKALSEGVAQYNALFAVYQNDSKMSDALMGFKKSIGELSEGALGFDILSQFSMPFVKTPANVVDRAIDYSPLGLIRNAARTGKETLGKNAPGLNQNRFVNETARNIIGTGLMAGAGAAAYNGAMSGKYSKDKDEKAAQKEEGEQEYAANLPDNYQMDIGWIPVLGSNSVAAAAAVDAMRDPELSGLDKVLAGAKAGGKAMFDQSMFQGLQRLFGQGDTYNSEEGIVGNMINTVKQGATQAVPSLARQIAQVADPYERDLSNGNYDINSIKNTLPIVRETLQPKVDSEGNYILQNQGRNVVSKILEDMILPGKITKIQPREMNTEAQRLQSLTGNNYAYIPKVQRSEITTDAHTPTDKEYTDYQVDRNKSMSDAGKIMMNTNYYKSASPEEQEKLLQDLYSNIKSAKVAEYTGKESDDSLVKLYNDNGHKKDDPKLLVRRMVQGEQIRQLGYKATDNLYNYMDKGGKIEDYKKFIDEVSHVTESGNNSIFKDDYMEAISKLPEKQRKLISDVKGVNFSDEEQAAYDKGGIDAALKVWKQEKAEKDQKAKEKEQKKSEQAKKANMSVEQMENVQEQLANAGAIDSPTTVEYYNRAKQTIPSLTPKSYANYLHQIGGNDYKISQKEMISYGNNNNLSEDDMSRYWNAFGNWKRNPVLVNGTWKAK